MSFLKESKVTVIGSGTMGTGIAQIAATYGHSVVVIDKSNESLKKSKSSLIAVMEKLVSKEKITAQDADAILGRIAYSDDLGDAADSSLVVEAIVENLDVKKNLFAELEKIVPDNCVLATNTSSLSIASISAALENNSRFIGLHFFNPAPVMKLVEVVPSFTTSERVTEDCVVLMSNWGKTPVVAKDTPGFIVNRVARPFYGEALRIYEEGIADFATIDWAMKEIGKFRMGPFELMDFIGNDVNYTVTETVFSQMYFDPRFKPSITQKRYLEAGYLGRKSGKGFYNYSDDANNSKPNKDEELAEIIFMRILVMLINEATDAVVFNVASIKGIDEAMKGGVNYPKGLLEWADELGIEFVLSELEILYDAYGEDRYRPSSLLRKMVNNNITFYCTCS